MLTQEEMIEKLKNTLTEKRLGHSIRVRETAVRLAQKYGADVEKVATAAILHDCAKDISYEESLKLCQKIGVELDLVTKSHRELVHAPLGAKLAEIEYGIVDSDILNAIYYHTTGREDMSMIEKIICISDYIEPKRSFNGIERIRELAYKNIDRALIEAFGSTISYIVARNYILHPTTVIARNSLIKRLEE